MSSWTPLLAFLRPARRTFSATCYRRSATCAMALRPLRGAPDRGRRPLGRAHRRRRGVSRAPLRSRIVNWSPGQARAVRLGPRRNVFSDYPHAVDLPPNSGPDSNCGRSRRPRSPTAGRRPSCGIPRARSDPRTAVSRCVGAAMRLDRLSTFCRPWRPRTGCSCAKSSHRAETGRAILRINTIATVRRLKPIRRDLLLPIRRSRRVWHPAPLHRRPTDGLRSHRHQWGSRDHPRRLSSVCRGLWVRCLLSQHACRERSDDGGD